MQFSRMPKQEEEGNYSSYVNEDVQESERHNLYVQLISIDFYCVGAGTTVVCKFLPLS